jgi:hypothetical protein
MNKIQDIDNQIKLQQTKVNIATNDEQRINAQNRIKVLKYKREIERIKGLIAKLQNN